MNVFPALLLGLTVCSCASSPPETVNVPPTPSATAAPTQTLAPPPPTSSMAVLQETAPPVEKKDPPAETKPSAPAPEATLARGDGSAADGDLAAGDKAYDGDDWAAAAKAYTAAAKKAPKDPAPIVGLVRVALGKAAVPSDHNSAPKNPIVAAAIRDLKRAVTLDPNYVPARIDLGRALLVQGKSDAALVELTKAASLGASSAEAHSALGLALVATGKPDEAIKELAKAASLEPDRAPRHSNLGAVLMTRQRTAEATAEFEQAVKLAPDDARALSNLGTAELAAGQIDKAIPHLEKALKIDPSRPAIHSNLSFAKLSKGDLDGAVTEAREALKLDDKFASAWINLGTALGKKKQFAEARKAFEKAQALDPSDPRPKANLEELKQAEGKPLGRSRAIDGVRAESTRRHDATVRVFAHGSAVRERRADERGSAQPTDFSKAACRCEHQRSVVARVEDVGTLALASWGRFSLFAVNAAVIVSGNIQQQIKGVRWNEW